MADRDLNAEGSEHDHTKDKASQEGEENGVDDPSSEAEGESKKRRTRTPSPQPSTATSGFTVPASPPKFVTFEELMSAANGVRNMTLAHEIVVDAEFRLEKKAAPENSIHSKVREIMHKAFWDLLQEELSQDPPVFRQALALIVEIKEVLLSLMLPQHVRLRAQVNEVLDLDLIQQQMEKSTFDIRYYGDYVIGIMARHCAPLRDERIAKLKEEKEIVPLFREILEVLGLMKMDMANFTIQQMRPYLQQQSVEYERTKFQEFLKQQEEHGTDGLEFTKAWLRRGFEKLKAEEESASDGATSGSKVTPATIMNEAYMELLQWEDSQMFPETLVMDQGRFLELRDKGRQLMFMASILLVTYTTVGTPISGIQELKTTLKNNILIVIGTEKDYMKVAETVADQVNKDVNECLVKHGFPELDEEMRKCLRGQITDVAQANNNVSVIMGKRIRTFIQDSITSHHTEPLKVPPGFSAFPTELSNMLGKFLRLISHNRSVFGSHYANIISSLMELQQDISPR